LLQTPKVTDGEWFKFGLDGEPASVATLPSNLILFVGLDDRVQRFPLHNRVLGIKAAGVPSAQTEVPASGDVFRSHGRNEF
jgi:hypothetical protein